MTLEEQISSVLNDPEAMNKISSIAASLGMQTPGASDGSAPPPSPQPNPVQQLPAALSGLKLPDMAGDDRTKLLMALKPFLSKKRASYVDGAVALMGMMQLSGLGGQSEGALGRLMSFFSRPSDGGSR